MASETKVEISIQNCLDDNANNNHDIEAWGNDLSNSINIIPGEKGILNITPRSGSLKVHLRTKVTPSKNGLKGVKIIPGWGPGDIHHIETFQKGNKFFAVLHYKTTTFLKGNKDQDRDPRIIHPDDPGND